MTIQSQVETELSRSLAELWHMPPPELERTTVTLMFTDIEDSTGLAATLGLNELACFLSHHMTLVQRIVRSHGGWVLDFTGDGVFALWPGTQMTFGETARSALAAATELSRHIAAENRERHGGGQPTRRVRIGVHSGEVLLGNLHSGQPSCVFGPAVNLTRRVEQAGKSVRAGKSQAVVMVSDATLQLAGCALTNSGAEDGKKLSLWRMANPNPHFAVADTHGIGRTAGVARWLRCPRAAIAAA